MSFLNQIIELLSQPPGGLIYHFGILFAIEATLGIALGYRQRPAVRRVALAAGGMLVGRLALMTVALLDSQGLIANPIAILPPLERAVDAIGTWLLIWALLPLFDKMPQWGNVLAGGGTFLLAMLYLFFAISWYAEGMGTTNVTYNNGSQDAVWEMIQLGLLGAAGAYCLLYRRGDWILRFGILAILFGTHLAHFGWALPEGNVAGWGRLGQLIAYPLLTVSTYRLVIGGLLAGMGQLTVRPEAGLMEQIQKLDTIAATLDQLAILGAAVTAIPAVTDASMVALLSFPEKDGTEARVVCTYRNGQLVSHMEKEIGLNDAPVLGRIINHQQAIFLRPGGADDSSRLLLLMHLLPETNLKTRIESALLIQPICRQGHLFGAFIVQPAAGDSDWLAGSGQLVDLLAVHVANALASVRTCQQLQARVDQLVEQLEKADETDRIGQLQAKLDKAREVERELAHQLGAAQHELAQVKRDVQGLDPLIKLNKGQRVKIAKLQEELDELTAELEQRAEQLPRGFSDPERATLAAQGLRRPLASISGYTDLLLGESVGAVGELQRLFLQRVKASTERARVLLDDLVQASACEDESNSLDLQPVQVAEIINDAVRKLGDQIEKKGLDLQIDFGGSLPLLEVDRGRMEQIVYHLLSNAFWATPSDGEVAVDVRYQANGAGVGVDGLGNGGYLFVSVRDSGDGVQVSDLVYVFDRHYRSAHPPIAGLGDTDMGLPLARELLQAQGGRIWIESELNVGSTLSMVLPATVVQR